MKKMALVMVFGCAAVLLSGCVFNIKGGCPQRCDGKVGDAVIKEIDAVGRLSSEPARLGLYKTIAARDTLNGKERTHLSDAVFAKLSSDANREAVLTILANNQYPPKAKQASDKKKKTTISVEAKGDCGK